MTRCECCEQEMFTAEGCTKRWQKRGEEKRPAVPFGYELRYPLSGNILDLKTVTPDDVLKAVARYRTRTLAERCPDCGVFYGEYHHPGCDIEECAFCLNQRLSCNCASREG